MTRSRTLLFGGQVLLVLLLGLLPLLPSFAATPTQQPSPDPHQGPYIRLLGWTFDPLRHPEPLFLPDSLRLSGYPEGQAGYYLIQFQGPIQKAWKEAVEQAGATLLDYIPDFTFIARMDGATREQVAGMPMVRWVGLYQPGYRIEPHLRTRLFGLLEMPAEPRDLRLSVFPDEEEYVRREVEALGGRIVEFSRNDLGAVMRVQIDPFQAGTLAGINGVRWVDMLPEWKLYNEKSADIMDVRDVWDNHGLYGQGQIVGVCDTGLDQGSTNPAQLHDDFEDGSGNSRVLQIFDRVGDGAADVNSGHGTHVAGSVLGNGQRSGSNPPVHNYPSTCFAGMAPEAQLVFQAVEDNNGYLSGIPADLNILFQEAYGAGARIHTNSWGSTEAGQYSIDSQNTDLFMWNNRDLTILFAAGNDGVDANSIDGVVDRSSSIGSPGTAKNCITVGASENNRSSGGINPGGTLCGGNPGGGCPSAPNPYWGNCWPNDFPAQPVCGDRVSNDPTGMAAFSSRGPTVDDRYKPDIVAPGTNILSTRSSQAGGTGWGIYNTYYLYMGGTSMATPLTAGATALAREFYTDQGVTPSGALLKATLVNGATDLYPGQYGTGGTQEQPTTRPNDVQGWGRVDLEDSLFPVSPRAMDYFDFAEGIETNEWDSFTFSLGNTGQSLRTTLAWTDYPGTPAAGGGLVNDLDLHVDDPLSTRHYPTNARQRSGTEIGQNDTEPWNVYTSNSSYRYAARFTPSSYPVDVKQALLFIYAASYPVNFRVWVYADDGGNGAPGTTLFGPVTYRATWQGWIAVPISGVTINSGGFYVAWQPTVNNAPYVVTDETAGGGDNRFWNGSRWRNWTNPDLNIRAVMARPDASTNYDRVNNLVGVDINTPPATGDYTVQVSGHNIANGPQPYALVNSGAITFFGAGSYRIFAAGDTPRRTFGRTGVEMDFASGPGGDVTVTMRKAAPTNPPPGGVTFVNLDWAITSLMAGFSTQIIFHYDESDLPGGMSENQIAGAYRWNGSSWSLVGGTVDTAANTVTVDNVTAFSSWALGSAPTAVKLLSFTATPTGEGLLLTWETASEVDNLGFDLYRSQSRETRGGRLNETLIPSRSPGGGQGATYAFLDTTALPATTYHYTLESVDISGRRVPYGPLTATLWRVYLPLVGR